MEAEVRWYRTAEEEQYRRATACSAASTVAALTSATLLDAIVLELSPATHKPMRISSG